jgi:hypothetical protein
LALKSRLLHVEESFVSVVDLLRGSPSPGIPCLHALGT